LEGIAAGGTPFKVRKQKSMAEIRRRIAEYVNTIAPSRLSNTFATIIIIVIVTMSEEKREMTNDGFGDTITDRKHRLKRMKDQGRLRIIKVKYPPLPKNFANNNQVKF
jgi:hypothetical protein